MIAILDYGMGNLRSVQKGFERVGYAAKIVSNAGELNEASGVVLPGVGAFPAAARNLRETGFRDAVLEAVERGVPLFGICLGYQLLFEESPEGTGEKGLGILKGRCVRFDHELKTPHMGWNRVSVKKKDGLFRGIENDSFFYFVHSYYPVPEDEDAVAGTTEYGTHFVSAVARGSVFGCQFHPEKSQQTGLTMLSNFGRMTIG